MFAAQTGLTVYLVGKCPQSSGENILVSNTGRQAAWLGLGIIYSNEWSLQGLLTTHQFYLHQTPLECG